jgi:hypothetical protein
MYIPCKLKQVIVFDGKVDFRKRFDGLLALCYQHSYNPYLGDCVIFLSRDKHQLRALFGDEYGLFLVCRRFEAGTIKSSFEKKEISLGELTLLLQGTRIKIQGQISSWQKNKE